MPQAILSTSFSAGGVSVQSSVIRSGDGAIGAEITLPAAKAGTLSTRTDNDTGVVTVSSGHGIVDTDTVDVYWDGGQRYDVDVTAVTSTTISIDLGSGDNLPIATTAVRIVKQVSFTQQIDGDNLKALGIKMEFADASLTSEGRVLFEDSAGDDIAALELVGNVALTYDIAGGASNPFTGDVITGGKASNSNSTYDATLKIAGVYDATP